MRSGFNYRTADRRAKVNKVAAQSRPWLRGEVKPLEPINPTEVPEKGDLVEIPGGEHRRVTGVFGRRPLPNGMEMGRAVARGGNCIRVRVEGMRDEIKAASVKLIERAKPKTK